MEFIVCKFGGTSVATQESLSQIARILDLKPNRRCVVVSAPGKAKGVAVKITDLLIKATQKALANQDPSQEIADIKTRF
jgi:aspartate kinase